MALCSIFSNNIYFIYAQSSLIDVPFLDHGNPRVDPDDINGQYTPPQHLADLQTVEILRSCPRRQEGSAPQLLYLDDDI